MAADMEVSITGCKVGKIHEVLWCHVKNLAEPVALHVDFEVAVSDQCSLLQDASILEEI